MAVATNLTNGRGRTGVFDAVAASQTDSALVTAIAGAKIRVVSVVLNQGDTTPQRSRSTRSQPGLVPRRPRH
jgi:hypothetical protein